MTQTQNMPLLQFLRVALALTCITALPAGADWGARAQGLPLVTEGVVVTAEPDDPYYPLAQEIAGAEGLKLRSSLEAGLGTEPDYLLWVVSPGRLSDPVMVEAGRLLRRHGMRTALGIITGETLERARELYRAGNLRAAAKTPAEEKSIIVAGAYSAIGLQQGFIKVEPNGPQQALSVTNLQAALRTASAMQYSGHGTGHSWGLAKGLPFTGADVPELTLLSIGAMSCQTLRPWMADSLAMAFVREGASAYAGFVFSPIDGYFMGERTHVPFSHTWPGFPIGRMVQIQAAQAQFSYARIPFYFLLGEPRQAWRGTPPYTLEQDILQDSNRMLVYRKAPSGILPVRVPGGAAYSFVQLPGQASRSDRDWFYNCELQTLNVKEDKFVIFTHSGGDFTLLLSRRTPWETWVAGTALDALDGALVFNQDYGGAQILLVIGVLAGLAILWHAKRKREPLHPVGRVLVGGAVLAGLGSGYILLRVDALRIIDKPVSFQPLTPAALLLVEAAAICLYHIAKTRCGRAVAWVPAMTPFWPAAVILSLTFTLMNVFAKLQIGGSIYGYGMAYPPLLAMGLVAPLVMLFFRWRE